MVHRQAQHGHEPADAVVGMDHQVPGGQVRIGLELLLIAVPLGPGLFTPAGQGPFSCLGDSEILAVKHFPFDMVPQFRKRTEDGAKRPAFVMR